MTDEDIVARVAVLFGLTYRKVRNRRPDAWKDSFLLLIRDRKAVLLMTQLRPLMGVRRRQQIARALHAYDPNRRFKHKDIPSAKQLRKLNRAATLRQLATRFGCSRQTILNRMNAS